MDRDVVDVLLLVARFALAGVFLVSGASKLADLAGARQAMRDFGVPARLVSPAALLLPIVELVAAIALLPLGSAFAGGATILALVVAFNLAICFNLLRGRRPDCHCFGQLSSQPIGWKVLARNIVLGAIAAFVVVAGRDSAGTDAFAWVGGGKVSEWIAVGVSIASLVVTLALFWLLIQMVAQNGRLLTRLESLEQRIGAVGAGGFAPATTGPMVGLPIGTAAPSFHLPGLHGETLTLEAMRATGKPTLLAFMDPGCGPCTAMLPDVARWQRELASTVNLAVLSRGTPEENRAKFGDQGLNQVLLQEDREVAHSFLADATPSMVLVRADGTIGSAVAQGAEEIRSLVARSMGGLVVDPYLPMAGSTSQGQPCPNCGRIHDDANAAAAPQMPAAVATGQPAPALKLPDLDGKDVDLADYAGRETVVLFWNPDCGFCQQMLPDLKKWESKRPDGAPALLVVSSGAVEPTRANGLMSTVVVDTSFGLAPQFGVNGTPMAVSIDAAGAVASAPAAGAEAVFGLLGGRAGS